MGKVKKLFGLAKILGPNDQMLTLAWYRWVGINGPTSNPPWMLLDSAGNVIATQRRNYLQTLKESSLSIGEDEIYVQDEIDNKIFGWARTTYTRDEIADILSGEARALAQEWGWF